MTRMAPEECAVRLLIRVVDGKAVEHACQLSLLHFGPHRCWCGWAFLRSPRSVGLGLPWQDFRFVRPHPPE